MGTSNRNGYRSRLRRVGRRQLLRGGVTWVTGGVALGLAGCSTGGSGNKPGSVAATGRAGSPGAAPRTAPPPPDAVSLATGGTIQGVTTFSTGKPNFLPDPFAPVNRWPLGFHFSRLFRHNAGPDPQTSLSREPVPDLVSSYEITDGGLTYTLKLRPDAIFHPPLSRPLTSADVKASWEYFNGNRTIYNNPYSAIVDGLATPDAATLVFKLKQPNAWFLNKLADPLNWWIISQDAVMGTIDPATQPIGTGPWIFVENIPTAFRWKRNPNYFIKDIPVADAVELRFVQDTATQETQFLAGKLDWLFIPTVTDVEVIQKAAPRAGLYEYATNGLSFLGFSPVQDPNDAFTDPRLRQAASLAVDRQALIDTLWSGRAVWENLVPPGLGKWFLDPRSKDQGSSAQWFRPDLRKARQLLTAAGHTSTEFKFLYPSPAYGDQFDATATAIARMLTSAGFKLSVAAVDYWTVYINNGEGIFRKGAPRNSIVYHLQTPFYDPDGFLTGMLTKDGNRNHDLLDDPELEALVRKQSLELDAARRLQVVYDIQRAHAEKMYYPPIIYTKDPFQNKLNNHAAEARGAMV